MSFQGYPYEETIDGVKTYSNVPFTESQPHGTQYTHTIVFSVPFVNYLAELGYDLDSLLTKFVDDMEGRGYTIMSPSISTPNDTTLIITYSASSPPALIAVAVILGIIALITYIVSYTLIKVVPPLTGSIGGQVLLAAIGIGFVGIVGIGLIMSRSKSKGT